MLISFRNFHRLNDGEKMERKWREVGEKLEMGFFPRLARA